MPTNAGWWITRMNDSGTFARLQRFDGRGAALAAAKVRAAQDPEHVYHIRKETSDGGVVFSAEVERVDADS